MEISSKQSKQSKSSKLKSQTTQIKLTTTQDTKDKKDKDINQLKAKKIYSRPQTAQCRISKTPGQSQVTYLTEKSLVTSKEKETFYFETVQQNNYLQTTKLKPASESNSFFINKQLSLFADEYLMESYLMPQKDQ